MFHGPHIPLLCKHLSPLSFLCLLLFTLCLDVCARGRACSLHVLFFCIISSAPFLLTHATLAVVFTTGVHYPILQREHLWMVCGTYAASSTLIFSSPNRYSSPLLSPLLSLSSPLHSTALICRRCMSTVV